MSAKVFRSSIDT
ncbi:unnamed protein product, partial [Rotaria sp. Silwood1]